MHNPDDFNIKHISLAFARKHKGLHWSLSEKSLQVFASPSSGVFHQGDTTSL